MTLNLKYGDNDLILTDEHAGSSYGQPVLVSNGEVLGPMDQWHPVPGSDGDISELFGENCEFQVAFQVVRVARANARKDGRKFSDEECAFVGRFVEHPIVLGFTPTEPSSEATVAGKAESGAMVEVVIHRASMEKWAGSVHVDGKPVDSISGLTDRSESTEDIAQYELTTVLAELNSFEVAVCATCGKLHTPPACEAR